MLPRNVHYPFEGPFERAKLEQELEGVDIARCFIDFGDFNSRPYGRTGVHVPMPDVRTWRKNAGSPTFASCTDGARLSDCFRGLATISALEPESGVQHRPVKLVIHVKPLTSCCFKWENIALAGLKLDQSSMAHLRELIDTDIDASLETLAPVCYGFCFPSAYPASMPVVFWLGILI